MKKIMLAIALIILVSVFCYADSCKDSGLEKEYKSDEGNCTYQTRTCCENGEWSEWDEECKVCGEGECWNGSMCEEPQTSILCTNYENNWGVVGGGSLTRKATCTSDGWRYGEWEGDCQCAEGSNWYENKCLSHRLQHYTVPSVGNYNDLDACEKARNISVNNHNSNEGYIRTDLSYQCTGLGDYGFIITPCQQYGGKYDYIVAAYECVYNYNYEN